MKNLSMALQRQKRKKNMERLSFITQFMFEFLLLFTGSRKVLGKMPAYYKKDVNQKIFNHTTLLLAFLSYALKKNKNT